MNDSFDEDINTFLIVVSVLLTVSKFSVVEILEVVLTAVDDVVETSVSVTLLPKLPLPLTTPPITVSDV